MTYQVGDWIPLSEWRRLPRVAGIYIIREINSRKLYIGQSSQIRRRLSAHNLNHKTSDYVLGRAMRQHGIESFEVSVRVVCEDATILSTLEMAYIAKLRCRAPAGYNMTIGGEGVRGLEVSLETRAKISKAMQLRGMSDELREKTKVGYQEWLKTPEAAKVFSDRIGAKRSDETRARISAAKVGTVWNEEAKQKQSERCMGRVISDSAKDKIRVISKARWSKDKSESMLKAKLLSKSIRLVEAPKLVIFTENSFCGVYATTYEDAAQYLKVSRPCITNWLNGTFKARVPVAIAKI